MQVYSSNGCYVRTDDQMVEILPAPLAFVLIEGNDEPFAALPNDSCGELSICEPLSLTAVNIPPGGTASWTINGDPVAGTVVEADTDGSYALTITAQNGCTGSTCLNIDMMQPVPLPNITDLQFDFLFDGTPLSLQDTIAACGEGCVQDVVNITWIANGQVVQLGPPYYLVHDLPNSCGSLQNYLGQPIYWSQQLNGTGWYPLNMHVIMYVEGCTNDSLVFDISDSVFIVAIDPPEIMEPDTSFICLGDTAVLVLDCVNCEQVEWSGPGLISVSADADSAWVNAFGFYTVIVANSEMGVECQAAAYYNVAIAMPPQLIIEPPGGLVCPGQPALIHTPFQSAIYEWSGPNGPLSMNNDSITVTAPGAYFLTTYTTSGCPLFNGPVNLQQFSTPVLQFVLDDVLCPGETAILQVQGGNIEQIAWAPPLSGGTLVQYVNTPGTYACTVTSCGVEVELFATLLADTISVTLAAGPYAFCPGGSVIVDGPSTPYQYLWTPGNVTTEDLVVSNAGVYQLQVMDSLGCVAVSNPVTVTELTFTLPVTVQGDSVCLGEDALLSAVGSGALQWYGDADLQQWLVEGDTLLLSQLIESDTVYVTQAENGCTGPVVAVYITVVEPPTPPVIMGDTMICSGDTLHLFVLPQPGVTYTWTTPQAQLTGPSITIGPMNAQDQGAYTSMASVAGCPGSQSTVSVVLTNGPGAPVISGDTILCLGDDLLVSVPLVPGITYTWTTPEGQFTGNTIEVEDVTLNDTGMYICLPVAANCAGSIAQVGITVQTPPQLPVISGPATLCEGEDDVLSVSGVAGEFNWIFPGGSFPGAASSIPLTGLIAANSGSYGVVVEGGACGDVSASIQIIIDPCEIVIPNVITPNGDGNNDVLVLEAPPGTSYSLIIHNRWGQEVWYMNGQVVKWNGTNQRHEMLPEGVYFYVFEHTTVNTRKERTGYIQVLHRR